MKRIERNHWSELVAAGTEYLAELAEQGAHVEYGQFNDRVCGGLFNLGDASERTNWAGSWATSPAPRSVSTA